MKKIAVFGGVFDPVHNGHIKMAEIVDKVLNPDILLFVPSGNPPHKRKRINSCRDRFNMLKIAVTKKFGEKAEVCDYEINESGLSYTAKTLSHLKGVYGKTAELYFVIGADNADYISQWYRPDIIRSLATITVVARPGFDKTAVKKAFPESVVCEGESIDVSSSLIRDLASRGKDFSQYVPKSVWEYIKEHKLYPKEMTGFSEIRDFVAGFLKESRMEHTLGVAETAVSLAGQYGCDVKKAEIAALIHDVAKNLSLQEMLNYCEKYDIIIDNAQKRQKALLHSVVSEAIAFFEMGIRDHGILSAVRYHTTGCADMDNLTKIIYLADAIEPNRTYEGVEKIRVLAEADLNKACLASLDNTIKFLLSENSEIYPETIHARNSLITDTER